MTYSLIDIKGISESYIYECNSYPFCSIDSNIFKKSIPLTNITGSYSISYNKNEYGNISPIGKIQKILLIKIISDGSLVDVTMYTNKYKIMPFPKIKRIKYLRKNNDVNILFYNPMLDKIYEPDEYYIFLSLEIISGDATITFETPRSSLLKVIENKNQYSYIFRYSQKRKNLLKIKANKNTAYSITLTQEKDIYMSLRENYQFQVGNNFLYELKNNIRYYNLSFIKSVIRSQYDNSYTYFRFFPINCQIEIKNDHSENLNNYQEVISIRNSFYNYNYNVERVDNKNESCKFYVSTYSLDINRSFTDIEATFISRNVQHYSIFNKEINKIKYFYPHTEIENDLIVNFTIKNETKDNYIFSIYINKNLIYNNISKRENYLTFNSSYIKNFCKDEKQICSIYFLLETNNKNETTVEFIVTSLDSNLKTGNNNSKSDNYFKKNLNIILIIIGSVILFSIIIILIVCFCKGKNNSDLSLKVNQISFEEERRNKNNEDDESLLS